jgi:hypothetical protein
MLQPSILSDLRPGCPIAQEARSRQYGEHGASYRSE